MIANLFLLLWWDSGQHGGCEWFLAGDDHTLAWKRHDAWLNIAHLVSGLHLVAVGLKKNSHRPLLHIATFKEHSKTLQPT
jgi:hypothetical protein